MDGLKEPRAKPSLFACPNHAYSEAGERHGGPPSYTKLEIHGVNSVHRMRKPRRRT
uniref:Uncharacterized protein n=1 Tax=Setaria italica TaxID=4555 RepID=K3ZG09_SETIT